MAINKYMKAALHTLSYLQRDIKDTYPIRRKWEKRAAQLRGMPGGFEIWDREVPCTVGGMHNVQTRIFVPTEVTPTRGLLFFHGGGWVVGNVDSYTPFCAELAGQTGCVVASVDYRLAPEHRFPCALEDCYAVAREIFNWGLIGIPPERVTMIGDSAGGNLSAAVSLMARERKEFTVPQQILIYPATGADHTEQSPYPSVHKFADDYLLQSSHICEYMELYSSKPSDFENPYFAPLLAEDLSGQPKTLIITAEYDPLRDEGELYGSRLQTAGGDCRIVRMPDALHGYLLLPPTFSLVKQTFEMITLFLEECP